MPLDEILNWLNSKKDFKAGVVLYIKHGSNNNLIRRFSRLGDIDFNKRLLEENLKQIARALEKKEKSKHKPATIVQTKSKKAAPKKSVDKKPIVKVAIIGAALPKAHAKFIDDLSKVDFACLPDVLKTLSTRKGDLYKEASILHGELMNCESDEQREAKARTIIGNMRENDLIYQEIRYFLENNKLMGEHPATAKPKDQDPEDDFTKLPADKLVKKIDSKVAGLSRLRRWVKSNPKHKDFEQKKVKITEAEAEIKAMRKHYDAIQSK